LERHAHRAIGIAVLLAGLASALGWSPAVAQTTIRLEPFAVL
jgi:hypothetical protein